MKKIQFANYVIQIEKNEINAYDLLLTIDYIKKGKKEKFM